MDESDAIKIWENDTLSAVVTEVTEADMLIILSDIDGLFDANPHTEADAKLIPYVKEINDEILAMAGGAGSVFSTGGMETKLNAAKRVMDNDQAMVIASAENPNIIFDIVDGKEVGTLFKKELPELMIQGDD